MRRLGLLGVLAACGRIGFDGGTDAASDVAPDAERGAFVPSAGTCMEADAGPFVEVAAFPTAGGGYGVFAAPPHVLMADTTGGLHNLRFTGTSFVELDRINTLGWVEAVWVDGPYIYVGAPGTGLSVLSADASGKLTVRAQDTTTLAEARRGWVSDGVTYVPAGPTGLHAVRFDGSAIAHLGAPMPSMSWAQGAWARDGRVLFADGGQFRILDFNGATFTDVITPSAVHGANRVWSDGDVIFVASPDGVTAYRLSGTTLVELDTFDTGSPARDVWSDGLHVFVAAEAAGFFALSFAADQFQLIERITGITQALGVFGDGTHIFTNDMTGGVHAYAGFACRNW